jgi:hypothetical protein
MTNDGHAILREIDVKHPAAKSMIELSRAQDEEVGDGTTSVIILAGTLPCGPNSMLWDHHLSFFVKQNLMSKKRGVFLHDRRNVARCGASSGAQNSPYRHHPGEFVVCAKRALLENITHKRTLPTLRIFAEHKTPVNQTKQYECGT